MKVILSSLIRFAFVAVLAMLASAAPAQPFPTRPIRLLVSFPPGGASDLVARTLGQPLGARLGQPIVVENRPGSNGNLAGELAAHATPDGYPLLLGPSSLFAINPHLYTKMAIDPLDRPAILRHMPHDVAGGVVSDLQALVEEKVHLKSPCKRILVTKFLLRG